ncbi:MAG: glycosyltransferase family 61 protein [Roseococcus sp.]|nr:glycosyltransferase family 61 protein [Roseococcus sp.]
MSSLVEPFAGRVMTFEGIGITRNAAGVIGRRKLPLRSALAFPPDSPPWVWNCSGGRVNNGHVPPEPVPADAPLIAGTYIYAGPIWESFGHVLAEFVHRLWVTELPEYQGLPVVFTATEGVETPRFLAGVMNLLGITDWRVLEGPARIERLVVAEAGKQLRVPSAPEYTAFLQRRLGHIAAEPARFPKKLAVLRGHLDQSSGRCFGESWMAQQLEHLGYLSFKPEQYPLHDQVNAYMHADHIIFSEGSAMHLFDIMPPVKAQIAVLNRRPGSPLGQHTLAGKCSGLHVYDDLVFLGDPREHLTRSLSLVDPPKFFAWLRERGFVDRVPETDLLDDAMATAEDLASFVKARHRSPKINRGRDQKRLLAETIAFLVRQALRPPKVPILDPALLAAAKKEAAERLAAERAAARAERTAARAARLALRANASVRRDKGAA